MCNRSAIHTLTVELHYKLHSNLMPVICTGKLHWSGWTLLSVYSIERRPPAFLESEISRPPLDKSGAKIAPLPEKKPSALHNINWVLHNNRSNYK